MIEKRITHGGFFDAFDSVKRQEIEVKVKRLPNNREAYDITEDMYEKFNGERRYNSFESFRRSYYAKKRRN